MIIMNTSLFDDTLIASRSANNISEQVKGSFKIKRLAEPDIYLGQKFNWVTNENKNKARNLVSSL